jgi:hypothetical protein
MMKTIGNYSYLLKALGLFLTLGCVPSYPDIILKITTMEGTALQEVGAGQPFLLNVIVDNVQDTTQHPTLQNIENIFIRQSGYHMTTINNVSTLTYQYNVRIDNPGIYTIGPARITESDKTLESKPLTVRVSDAQKINAKKNTATTFVRITTDKSSLFMGQKIVIHVTFYTSDDAVSLQTLHEPESIADAGFVLKQRSGPTTGTETLHKITYRFARWDYQVTTNKEGVLTLPAFAADYSAPSRNDMLSFFFTVGNSIKRIYSNSLAVNSIALPQAPANASSFIGTVREFTAGIDPAHARVGQAAVLTLTLIAQGDFENSNFNLQDMPRACKWYVSKHQETPWSLVADYSKYTQEFIIQPLESGEFQIPSQSFTYFDATQRSYKTIKSNSLNFTVSGTMPVISPTTQIPHISEEPTSALSPIAPFAQYNALQQVPRFYFPWFWYWAAVSMLLISWLATNLAGTLFKNIFSLRLYNPYARARKNIQSIEINHRYQGLYLVFIQLFAIVLHTKSNQITGDNIAHYLRTAGLSQTLLQEWELFFSTLTQIVYAQDAPVYSEIILQSVQWVDILEKLSRNRS